MMHLGIMCFQINAYPPNYADRDGHLEGLYFFFFRAQICTDNRVTVRQIANGTRC